MIVFTPILLGAAIGTGIATPDNPDSEFLTADFPHWSLLATKWQGRDIAPETLRDEVRRVSALSDEEALSEYQRR